MSNLPAVLRAEADAKGSAAGNVAAIAPESNVRALDATLEAARAAGKGGRFAAAASEVSKLAAQTQQATESVARLVTEIQQAARNSAEEISSIARVIEELTAAGHGPDTAAEIARWTAHLAARAGDFETRVASLFDRIHAA